MASAAGKQEDAALDDPVQRQDRVEGIAQGQREKAAADLVNELAEGIVEGLADRLGRDFERRSIEAEAQRHRTVEEIARERSREAEERQQRALEQIASLEAHAANEEANLSNLAGVIDDTERLAAELFEHALAQYPEGRNGAWITWIKVCPVQPHDNPSDVSPFHRFPAPPTTRRELCRRAWSEGIRDFRLRNLWFEYELSERNIGESRDPAPFSARWLARQSDWMEDAGQRIDPNFLNRWIDLELEENVGPFVNPPSYSARSIFRWAWDRSFHGPAFLVKWLELEKRDGNIDADVGWSVRDICLKAWAAGVRHLNFVLWWARFEIEQGNVGGPSNPTAHTARWIFQEAWEDRKQDVDFVVGLLDLEEKELNFGDLNKLGEYTARWIYRTTWDLSDLHFKLLFRWFALERSLNNNGDISLPYTALWIDDNIVRMYPSWRSKESLSIAERQHYLDAGGQLRIVSGLRIVRALGFQPLSGPRGSPDNLKEFDGVSPTIEKSLNDLGLFHFWQVAALTPEAAKNIGEEIGLPGCIDRWVGQAKDLSGS